MRRFAVSLWEFVKGTYGALGALLVALSDPLDWLKALGMVNGHAHWAFEPWMRQALFAAIALTGLFIWFHARRIAFENANPKPDLPLYKAAQYLARDTAWAASQRAEDDEGWTTAVTAELFSALASGRVQAWGREKQPGEYTRDAMVPIPIEALRYATWDSHKLFSDVPPWRIQTKDNVSFARVCVNLTQVREEWPKRSLRDQIGGVSPIDRLNLSAEVPHVTGYGRIFSAQDENYKATPYTAHFLEIFD